MTEDVPGDSPEPKPSAVKKKTAKRKKKKKTPSRKVQTRKKTEKIQKETATAQPKYHPRPRGPDGCFLRGPRVRITDEKENAIPLSTSRASVAKYTLETLLKLMAVDQSGSVRVAAARAVFDKYIKNEAGGDDKRGNADRTRAIAEARAILDELAEAKLGSAGTTGALDQDGSAGTTDPQG
jgi:hypothetical protein